MNCAWKELLGILPSWLAQEVDKFKMDTLQEIRLRRSQPPQLISKKGNVWLIREVAENDLNFCINTASRYSPWSAQTMADGYITAPGGHRIGICGEAVITGSSMTGIRTVRSLCIRIARDFPGIAEKYCHYPGSILIIGPPGSGKTTLLRDLIRQISMHQTIAVVDERRELFPNSTFKPGKAMDVLSGCPKTEGIDTVLRTMGPETVAIDEITAVEDCEALQRCGWCGVRLVATTHAASVKDLHRRPIYKPLLQDGLFEHILIMNRDKTLHEERMNL